MYTHTHSLLSASWEALRGRGKNPIAAAAIGGLLPDSPKLVFLAFFLIQHGTLAGWVSDPTWRAWGSPVDEILHSVIFPGLLFFLAALGKWVGQPLLRGWLFHILCDTVSHGVNQGGVSYCWPFTWNLGEVLGVWHYAHQGQDSFRIGGGLYISFLEAFLAALAATILLAKRGR